MSINLDKAIQLLTETIELVDENLYPEIVDLLAEARYEIRWALDYEDEADKYRRES